MNITKEFIMFAAGLCMTVSIIGISLGIFGKAVTLSQKVESIENEKCRELYEYELSKYDGQRVSGSKAINYIKSMFAAYDATITVTTDRSNFIMDSEKLAQLRNSGSRYYINPLCYYRVNLEIDDNSEVTNILINEI